MAGEVRVAVRASDATQARALLESMPRNVRRETASDPPPAVEDACLSCGQPLVAGSEACGACGWSFAGEAEVAHVNGPIPASLLAVAWSPISSRRFGLRHDAVQRHVDWCRRNDVEIRGFELWRAETVGHTVIERFEPATADELRALAASLVTEQARSTYFSIDATRGIRRSEGEGGFGA